MLEGTGFVPGLGLRCEMTNSFTWDEWLDAEDSVSVLAPKSFDHEAARQRVVFLRQRLVAALEDYEIRASSLDLYQDSTGMVSFRVTAKGEATPVAPTLAWIVLSHFGNLATVIDCQDLALRSRTGRFLEEFGLQYIPYDYATKKIYHGLCRGLRGFSWANRYFELCVEFNEQFDPATDYFV
jgi:hypothetical protein